MGKKVRNKRNSFTIDYAIRMQDIQIECADALRIIRSRDTPDSFFYCDPPYYNSNCGHYDGYTIEDYEALLKTLSQMEGKFLLSSYPSDILDAYIQENNWNCRSFDQVVSVARKKTDRKKKIEVLTWNY